MKDSIRGSRLDRQDPRSLGARGARRRRRHRWAALLMTLAASLALASSAGSASAAQLLGRIDGWSPHKDAPASGWTKLVAAQNLGSGTGHDWGPDLRFRAANDRTRFMRQILGSTHGRRLTRNQFFRVGAQYRYHVDLRWRWRGADAHRYRYVTRVTLIYAGA